MCWLCVTKTLSQANCTDMTFFDQLTIFIFLVALIGQVVLVLVGWKFKTLKWWVLPFVLVLLFGQVALIYGSLIEPHWIEVRREQVSFADSEDSTIPLKVAFVADFHLGPYKQSGFAQEVVNLINAEEPDLVLIGGDFIYSYQDQADYLFPLADLQSKYGVFAVLGNHDYGLTQNNLDDKSEPGAIVKSDYVADKLAEFEVEVLRNEIKEIEVEGEVWKLVGLEDLWGGRTDYQDILRQVSFEDRVILLEHNPDIILDEFSHRVDLILSGHTHGGQLRLPGVGALAGTPTVLSPDYAYGLFDWNEHTQLLVTKGVGEMGP